MPIFDGQQCVIVDDFMRDATGLVDHADENHIRFEDDPHNDYPGPELPLVGAFMARVRDSFPPPEVPATHATGSSRYFEKVPTVAPRYNRAIFYDGRLFHSGDLHAPGPMANDPRTGRLTVNAFFRMRMAAG